MAHARTFVPTLFLAASTAIVTAGPARAQDDDHEAHEIEEVVVQATRSRRRVQDEAIRVEVLNREEIEEKLLMRPGNISMMLAETGGLRVQVTSPSLGSANIRVQGMRGRYTQLLADGLPLYGGQASSLGLLQIPPSDLGQVEVIKGTASALYGGRRWVASSDLVSRRPGHEAEGEMILNATTRTARISRAMARAGSAPDGAARCLPTSIASRPRTWTTTAGSTCRATTVDRFARGCSGTGRAAQVPS